MTTTKYKITLAGAVYLKKNMTFYYFGREKDNFGKEKNTPFLFTDLKAAETELFLMGAANRDLKKAKIEKHG